jgi:hypothetical protein
VQAGSDGASRASRCRALRSMPLTPFASAVEGSALRDGSESLDGADHLFRMMWSAVHMRQSNLGRQGSLKIQVPLFVDRHIIIKH